MRTLVGVHVRAGEYLLGECEVWVPGWAGAINVLVLIDDNRGFTGRHGQFCQEVAAACLSHVVIRLPPPVYIYLCCY